MNKKKFTAAAALVLAFAVITGATVAYLVDRTDKVTNTFTVGDVALKLDEALVNENGKPGKMEKGEFVLVEDIAEADRVEGNKYLLIPGQTYTKDPTTTVVKDSVDSYVRMKVKVTDLDKLMEAIPNSGETKEYYVTKEEKTVFLLQKLVGGWEKDTWNTEWSYGYDPETFTYEFRYKEIVPASASDTKLAPLFNSFTLPWFITNEQLKTLENFKIEVTAEAIQAATFENAAKAWEAFDKQKTN